MHRSYRKPCVLAGGLIALLLGLLPSVGPHAVHAQNCSPESRPLVVLLNSTTRLQMSTRKPIKTVINPKEGILTIRTVERDPTTVILVGQGPGITRVELEDNDGNREVREVAVQADVEYLQAQLRRVVPISSIQCIPSGSRTVILAGYVGRAEDINVVQAIARSMGFEVINGLRLNGVQQVQLDVVLARVNRSKDRGFGFNFIGNARQNIFGSTPGSSTAINNFVGVPSAILQPSQFGQIINATPSATSTIFGGIIGNAAGFIGFLRALEAEGLVKILSQPRVVAMSGNPGTIHDGGQQAVPTAAGLGVAGVEFREFGTDVDFLPVVLGNGRIHLEVEPRISALDAAAGTVINGSLVAGRTDQRVRTTVELETGQTFVIGGLIQRTMEATANKVPVLGQIPFFGVLFSQKTSREVETELVIMVTPHLVDAQSACQVTKIVPGQETRSTDDFELFLEGILEAPRGPRQVFHGNRYVPAHLTGPTADLFPCAGRDCSQQPLCGGKAGSAGCCPTGNCTTGAVTHTAAHGSPPATLPATMPGTGNPMPAAMEAPPAQQSAAPTGTPASVTPEGPPPTAPGTSEAVKAETTGLPGPNPPPPPTAEAPTTPPAPGPGQP